MYNYLEAIKADVKDAIDNNYDFMLDIDIEKNGLKWHKSEVSHSL